MSFRNYSETNDILYKLSIDIESSKAGNRERDVRKLFQKLSKSKIGPLESYKYFTNMSTYIIAYYHLLKLIYSGTYLFWIQFD